MNKKIYWVLSSTVVITLVVASLGVRPFSSSAAEQPVRKIVVFKSGVLSDSARENLISKFGAVKIKNLDLIDAKAVMLSPRMEAALARQAGILRIDDDVIVEALARGGVSASAKPAPSQPAEVLPWGIDRIDAEKVWGGSEDATAVIPGNPSGQGIKVAIIDTGIDLKHPDLKANIKGGYNAIDSRKSANDDNGHGTHVAGIVAAVDNTIGVIGVGPGIDLYAVKVLDRNGSGYLSDVIEGLDWAIQNNMQVVNMSLGSASGNQSFYDAVLRVNAAGIVQVAAAGNSGGAVIYPAAYPEVIAVSATDITNTIADFSSRGPEVDLAAPGVNIYSTYKGSTYKELSGTSMAAPHVTGTAALVLTVPEKCQHLLDNVSGCSPDEVQKKLQDTAIDLENNGFDNLYGWGLVQADQAVK